MRPPRFCVSRVALTNAESIFEEEPEVTEDCTLILRRTHTVGRERSRPWPALIEQRTALTVLGNTARTQRMLAWLEVWDALSSLGLVYLGGPDHDLHFMDPSGSVPVCTHLRCAISSSYPLTTLLVSCILAFTLSGPLV